MFNILFFSPEKLDPKSYGYEKLYGFERIKERIVRAKTLAEAAELKNRAVLIALESYDFDEGAIKLIAEKKKACFLIDLSKIIFSYGTVRAIQLAKLRTFLRLCTKHGAYYTFADFAPTEFELRRARELVHIALLLGLNEGQAKFAMKMLKQYAE